MKNQALFSSKNKFKNLKCLLQQFLFGALRVKQFQSYIFQKTLVMDTILLISDIRNFTS